jgi:hypothetical protein
MKLIDLTGKRFGHLLVVGHHPRKTPGCRNIHWLCRCDCGRFLIVRGDNLKDGRTVQCSECRGHGGGKQSIFVERVMNDGVV